MLATELGVTLTWWTVQPASKASVYLSTAIGTGCNSGYFGAQYHHDANGNSWQSLLFSMWDNPSHVGNTGRDDFPFQGMPAGENCWRNALDSSGKSTGVQCGQPWPNNPKASIKVELEIGVPYEFKMSMRMQNDSGAMWEVTFNDPVHDKLISVGKMFFADKPLGLPAGTCRAFGRSQNPPAVGLSSYTFLEYFAPPFDYTTVASWSDLKVTGPTGTANVPDIVQDCCGHTYGTPPTGGFYDTSRKCLPPECDSLELRMMCGPYVHPSKAAFAANPGCKTKMNETRAINGLMQDCWEGSPPNSLDECFKK